MLRPAVTDQGLGLSERECPREWERGKRHAAE